jgi:hypothetical protein
MPIVTSTYRYKRPHSDLDITPDGHKRRGHAADALFREVGRPA